MERIEFSEHIFQNYFGPSKRLLKISLCNGDVLTGLLIGFFRLPNENSAGPVYAWRMIGDQEIEDYRISPEKYQVHGRIILQSEIFAVDFM